MGNIKFGDFNNDGFPDVYFGTRNQEDVDSKDFIYLNRGIGIGVLPPGIFQRKALESVLNQCCNPDPVVCPTRVCSPPFGNGAPAGYSYDAEVGDLNLDGIADIVIIALTGGNTARVYLGEDRDGDGKGDGTFVNVSLDDAYWTAIRPGSGLPGGDDDRDSNANGFLDFMPAVLGVDIGDIDGDGAPDIAIALGDTALVQNLVFLNNLNILTLSPRSVDVQVSGTTVFVAQASLPGSTLAFSVNDVPGGDLATIGSISPSGLYTAPAVAPSPTVVTIKVEIVGLLGAL